MTLTSQTAHQSLKRSYLKLVQHLCESTEEEFSFAEDGQEAAGVVFDHAGEYGLLSRLAHTFKLVRDADKPFHLTVVFCPDLFERRTELQPPLPEEKHKILNNSFCEEMIG